MAQKCNYNTIGLILLKGDPALCFGRSQPKGQTTLRAVCPIVGQILRDLGHVPWTSSKGF